MDEFLENLPMAKAGGAGALRGNPVLTPQTRGIAEEMPESSEED
ncbi:hypothetical protein ABTY61_31935 [Kitasatospora sp. NPDC096128]